MKLCLLTSATILLVGSGFPTSYESVRKAKRTHEKNKRGLLRRLQLLTNSHDA